MKCPVCRQKQLIRTRYEDMPVRRCESCLGYLVGHGRAEVIKLRHGKSVSELEGEALDEYVGERQERIRCPRCKVPMSRELAERKFKFQFDVCKSCELVWFDAGELALLQLDYELSAGGKESRAMHERYVSQSAGCRKQIEQQLDRHQSGFVGGLTQTKDAIIESLIEVFSGFDW